MKQIEDPTEKKVETYQDMMNRLNLNSETKKIIVEKIEELHKDLDGKILERQKKLDETINQIQESLKKKK
jgi:hypothetical protein